MHVKKIQVLSVPLSVILEFRNYRLCDEDLSG